MDKLTDYKRIIRELLNEYATSRRSATGVERQIISDDEHGQYQLISVGWHNNQFIYTIAFHFSITNNKVWIQQNNTESMIADELVERGIDKHDIVLGFLPERVRGEAGFAVS